MAAGPLDILRLRVADREFAIPVDRVREVVRAVSLSPAPVRSERIEGLLNLRGRSVSVLALGVSYGIVAGPLGVGDNLVVVESGDDLLAVRSESTVELQTGEVESPGGLVRVGSAILGLVDVDRLFADDRAVTEAVR